MNHKCKGVVDHITTTWGLAIIAVAVFAVAGLIGFGKELYADFSRSVAEDVAKRLKVDCEYLGRPSDCYVQYKWFVR